MKNMDRFFAARADCFQASACYMKGGMDTSRCYANHAFEYFQMTEQYEKAGCCRSMLGLIATKKGGYAEALNCFFDIVHSADKQSLKSLKTFGMMNLADLGIQFEDWQDALDYFIASERSMDQYDNDPRKPYFYLAACVQGMTVASRLGDEDAVNDQLSKARWLLQNYPQITNNLEMSVFLAMQALLDRDHERLYEACRDFIDAYRKEPERLDYTTETLEMLHLTREHGFDDLFEQLIWILREENFAAQGCSLALQVAGMQLSWLEEKGRAEEFNEELKRGRMYYENFYDCVNPSMIALFRTQSRLYSSENVNAQLQAMAETIRSSVKEGCGDMEIPEFTVSQGIVSHEIRADNQIRDYTSAADSALYACKKAGKDCITLIHRKTDLDNH